VELFEKLFRKAKSATAEQAAGSMARLIAQAAADDLDAFVAVAELKEGSEAARLMQEVFSLYVFAADSSLFNLYHSGPLRSAIMNAFWSLHSTTYKTTPHASLYMPTADHATARISEYAEHYRSPGNPLPGIGITFSRACGQPRNLHLGLMGVQRFAGVSGAIQEMLKGVTIRD
jgi:hypothetical protein